MIDGRLGRLSVGSRCHVFGSRCHVLEPLSIGRSEVRRIPGRVGLVPDKVAAALPVFWGTLSFFCYEVVALYSIQLVFELF